MSVLDTQSRRSVLSTRATAGGSMKRAIRTAMYGCAGVLCVTLFSATAYGQAAFDTPYQTTDFSGEWTEIAHEVGFTADLYDYTGIPYNAAGKMRADTGDISD